MTTFVRRSVDFRDEPEIINDTDLQSDDDSSRWKEHVPTLVHHKLDKNGNLNEITLRKDTMHSLETEQLSKILRTVKAEIHSEDSSSTTNTINESAFENIKEDVTIKMRNDENIPIAETESLRNDLPTNIKPTHDQFYDLSSFSSYASDANVNNVTMPFKKQEEKVVNSTLPTARVQSDHLNHRTEMPNDTGSTLSYTSFPGCGNFVLMKANDWLKQGRQYDKDGFSVQGNFSHFDVPTKHSSHPWLSQFRRTTQHVYVSPNGKVIENISVQDHDGKSFITSYHTNKELKSHKSQINQKRLKDEDLEAQLKKNQRELNNISVMFYAMLFLGLLLVVAFTLLIVYVK